MYSRIHLALPTALALALLSPASPALAKKGDQPMARTSSAVSKEMIDALAQELERSMTMQVPGAPGPYFVSYKLTEVEVNDASATLGAKTASKNRHFVTIEAHVHVGSYKMDNTNFVVPQRESVDGIATAQLPLEATPKIARKLAWLATDQAYKEALEQFTAKRDALASGASSSGAPSYAPVKPAVMETPVDVVALEAEAELAKRARELSRAFIGDEHIRDSRVALTSFVERRWYLNSEGTSSHDTRRVSGVLIAASAQAKDGQELARYFTKYGHSAADLPGDEQLVKEAEKLSVDLKGLIDAPVVGNYTGPVLFEDDGAVGMVRYTLHPHLTGTPPPVGVSAQERQVFGGGLGKRLDRRITATNLEISDDPSSRFIGKVPVIGGYKFDDEGVASQAINIVKRGILETLPTSRTPSKELQTSNGHARRSVEGGLFRGSPTNLVLESVGRGEPRARLRRKLLALIKKENLPYGLIIRQFDDPAITSNPDLSRIELVQLLRSQDPTAPPMAALAYKLYPTGKQELVRGVKLKSVDVNEWRGIAGVGQGRTIKNFLASTENPLLTRLQGGTPDGFVPSAGVESAVATPDLLFPELTIEPSSFGRRAAPILPPPAR